jgi:N-ethylmaleimide reductase
MEVAQAVAMEWSPGRVGIQVSPTSALNAMSDSDPLGLFTLVAERLSPIGIGYLHVHEPTDGRTAAPPLAQAIRGRFDGPMILNGGHDGATGARAVAGGHADMISFGRPFIVHPDLPARLAAGAPLRRPDPATFYGGGAEGYTDYPTLIEDDSL